RNIGRCVSHKFSRFKINRAGGLSNAYSRKKPRRRKAASRPLNCAREILLPLAPVAAVPARRALFPGTRDVDGDGAALEVLVVELFDGLLRLFRRGKFHEREAAR